MSTWIFQGNPKIFDIDNNEEKILKLLENMQSQLMKIIPQGTI